MQFDERTGAPRLLKGMENYLQSKAGEVLLAEEWNRRYEGKGVLNLVYLFFFFLSFRFFAAFATFRKHAPKAQVKVDLLTLLIDLGSQPRTTPNGSAETYAGSAKGSGGKSSPFLVPGNA